MGSIGLLVSFSSTSANYFVIEKRFCRT